MMNYLFFGFMKSEILSRSTNELLIKLYGFLSDFILGPDFFKATGPKYYLVIDLQERGA